MFNIPSVLPGASYRLILREGLYGDLMSPATIKPTWVIMQRGVPDNFARFPTKSGRNRKHIFIKVFKIKFRVNTSSGIRADAWGQTKRWGRK